GADSYRHSIVDYSQFDATENINQDVLPPSISALELKLHLEKVAQLDPTTEENKRNQRKFQLTTYKNLIIICVAFLLQSVIGAIGSLQSSLNTEAQVGVNSLSIVSGTLIVSSIFLPHPIIAIFGLKWALVISHIPYLLYIGANYYPKAYLMYPASVFFGLGNPVVWKSASSYITDAGTAYAKSTKSDRDLIVNRFFSIFFMFYQSGQIWGNLISFLVLKPIELVNENATDISSNSKYDKCGAEFSVHDNDVEVVNQISRQTINILCTIYIVISACGILLLVIFLDQRRKSARDRMPVMLKQSVKLLVSTVTHLKQFNQILLIPLTDTLYCV
ncbi:unnamed protein product, partial [Didymodactylos carnosus]